MKLASLSSARLLLGALALVFLAGQAHASAIRLDAGFNSSTFARNDDSYIGVNTGINFDFFGIAGPNLYINNNGNVTFNAGLSTYTPSGITSGSTPMIAPFFADVDTSGVGVGEPVRYGSSTVDGHSAFGVNWLDVAHYSEGLPLNSFQLVIIDRSDIAAGDFDFEFNYGSILWESGQASGGNASGLGGTSAHVGYTNGAGTYLELAGSGVNGALLDGGPSPTSLIQNSINSNIDGRYLFQVRNGAVEPPINVPEPASLALLGLGLFGLGFSRRKKA